MLKATSRTAVILKTSERGLFRSAFVVGAAFAAMTVAATAVHGQSTGVAACDDFLAKYETCITSKISWCSAGDVQRPVGPDAEGVDRCRQERGRETVTGSRLQAER